MPSASFTANGSPSPVIVTASTTVTLALTSVTGVRLIEWSIISCSDSTQVIPTITPTGSPLGATATFPFGDQSSAGLGLSFLVQCRINGGVDDAGQPVSTYTATLILGKNNAQGILPFCPGEDLERNAINGIYQDLNKALKTVGGGGSSDLATVLGIGNSAGSLKITNLGLCTAGGDAANKTYVDSRTLAVILAGATSAGGAKITNLGTPTNSTDAATKGYVDSIGGGGENLNATLTIGNSAGGLNITGVGFYGSNGELDLRQGASNTILGTTSGVTLLTATSGRIAFRQASTEIGQITSDGTYTIMAGSALRSGLVVSVDAGAASDGRPVIILGGGALGTNKAGGAVLIRGNVPTGSGALGYVDIQKTDGASSATFRDTGITFALALTSSAAGTFSSLTTTTTVSVGSSLSTVTTADVGTTLTVRNAGPATVAAASGTVRMPTVNSGTFRNAGNTADRILWSVDSSENIAFGSSSNPVTDLNSNTLTRMRVNGANVLSCTTSLSRFTTPLQLDSILTIQPIDPATIPTPTSPYYAVFLDSTNSNRLSKKAPTTGTVTLATA